MHDPVNHPQYYATGAIECIEAIEASMSPEAYKGFLKGNIQKYVWRYEQKGGAESLKKAEWYLLRLIAVREAEEAKAAKMLDAVKEVMGKAEPKMGETEARYDPDDYMISGCPDGFCPMPNVRQGPSQPMFAPIS